MTPKPLIKISKKVFPSIKNYPNKNQQTVIPHGTYKMDQDFILQRLSINSAQNNTTDPSGGTRNGSRGRVLKPARIKLNQIQIPIKYLKEL